MKVNNNEYKENFMSLSKREIETIFKKEKLIFFTFDCTTDELERKFKKLEEKVKNGENDYRRSVRRLNMILTRLAEDFNAPRVIFDKFLELFTNFRDKCFDYAV